MQVAYHLGITEEEVQTWDLDKFERWVAFLKMQLASDPMRMRK